MQLEGGRILKVPSNPTPTRRGLTWRVLPRKYFVPGRFQSKRLAQVEGPHGLFCRLPRSASGRYPGGGDAEEFFWTPKCPALLARVQNGGSPRNIRKSDNGRRQARQVETYACLWPKRWRRLLCRGGTVVLRLCG